MPKFLDPKICIVITLIFQQKSFQREICEKTVDGMAYGVDAEQTVVGLH